MPVLKMYCKTCGRFICLTDGTHYTRMWNVCHGEDCESRGPHVLYMPGDSLFDKVYKNRRRHEQQQQLRRPTPSFRHPQV